MPDLDYLLSMAEENRASDLHIAVNLPPMLRVDGDLVESDYNLPLDTQETSGMLLGILNDAQHSEFELFGSVDISYQSSSGSRYRVNIFKQMNGIEGAFRRLMDEIPTPEFLGLPVSVVEFSNLKRGLVLVTGQTGSGKSTTIASLVERINIHRKVHILTIEDPIEYIYQSKNALIRQREVGQHTESFTAALRHALRQDPDVIVVGEMRDFETISLALTAAETGHLCFATLHTGTSQDTIDRIIDVFPPSQQQQVRAQLASVLKGVVSQSLIKKITGGRTAAFEVLLVDSAISNMIRDNKSHLIQSHLETGAERGMISFDRCLANMVDDGIISYDEGLLHSRDQRLFMECLKKQSFQIIGSAA